jgi:hypothetical protein
VIGYKKCYAIDDRDRIVGYVLVTLDIPADAKMVLPNATQENNDDNKCRASRAVVTKLEWLPSTLFRRKEGGEMTVADLEENRVVSLRSHCGWRTLFFYTLGATVEPEAPFDDREYVTCGSGINFFQERKRAEEYYY